MPTHTLVVGGTRGNGLSFVRRLADCGVRTTVFGRRGLPPELSGLAHVRFETVELGATHSIVSALDRALSRSGTPDGVALFQRFRSADADDRWEGELAATLTATRTIVEYLAERVEKQRLSIVAISSIAARLVAGEQPVGYHTAKAGLEAMVRFYAATLGPRGIRVNAVVPGSILKDEARAFYEQNPQLLEVAARVTPLGRMGSPEDVADAVEFLLSDRAAFITGQCLLVDGGLSLQGQESLARQLLGVPLHSVQRR